MILVTSSLTKEKRHDNRKYESKACYYFVVGYTSVVAEICGWRNRRRISKKALADIVNYVGNILTIIERLDLKLELRDLLKCLGNTLK